jgi:phosphatidylinositol glycan class T
LNIELSYSATERKNHNINYPPLLEVHRYLTGSGHERGGLEIVTTNRHTNASPTVSIFDMVPWYFRLLYHTFNISCTYINGSNCDHDLVVLYSKYTPAKDRYKSHSSEYIIKIPPLSAVTFSVQFLRAFLKWNEHPPDSSHGFYIK